MPIWDSVFLTVSRIQFEVLEAKEYFNSQLYPY